MHLAKPYLVVPMKIRVTDPCSLDSYIRTPSGGSPSIASCRLRVYNWSSSSGFPFRLTITSALYRTGDYACAFHNVWYIDVTICQKWKFTRKNFLPSLSCGCRLKAVFLATSFTVHAQFHSIPYNRTFESPMHMCLRCIIPACKFCFVLRIFLCIYCDANSCFFS